MVPASDGQSQRRERAADWGSVSAEGESSRLRVSLSTSLRSPFPPLTLTRTQNGHHLPSDGETWVEPHYFCLVHKFMLLLQWTEEVKYSLILKKTQAANNNNTSLYRHFPTHSLLLQCWLYCWMEVGLMHILWFIKVLNTKCWQCWVRI